MIRGKPTVGLVVEMLEAYREVHGDVRIAVDEEEVFPHVKDFPLQPLNAPAHALPA